MMHSMPPRKMTKMAPFDPFGGDCVMCVKGVGGLFGPKIEYRFRLGISDMCQDLIFDLSNVKKSMRVILLRVP